VYVGAKIRPETAGVWHGRTETEGGSGGDGGRAETGMSVGGARPRGVAATSTKVIPLKNHFLNRIVTLVARRGARTYRRVRAADGQEE
jgi:hypothetical protein